MGDRKVSELTAWPTQLQRGAPKLSSSYKPFYNTEEVPGKHNANWQSNGHKKTCRGRDLSKGSEGTGQWMGRERRLVWNNMTFTAAVLMRMTS